MKSIYFLSFIFLVTQGCSLNDEILDSDTFNEFNHINAKNYKLSNNDSIDLNERLFYIDKYLSAVTKDSLKIKGLMQKTFLFGTQKKYDSAIIYSKKIWELASKKHDSFYLGRALQKLGFYHRKQNKIKESFKYYNEAYINFKSINDSVYMAKSLLAMSQIQKSTGDFIGSKITAVDALKFLNNSSEEKTRVALLQNISTAFREEGNYSKALKYNKEAKTYNISDYYTRTLNNTKANLLSDIKKYDEAITILSQLQSEVFELNKKKEIARISTSLGRVQWLKNPDNKISENLLRKAYAIRLEMGDIQGLISSSIRLTKYYENKNLQMASDFAGEALDNATKINSQTSQLEALSYIIKLKANPKKEAILYESINKDLTKINQKNRDLYSVTKYENEKLITQNLITEADNLKKDKLNTIYLLGFIILALTSIIVFILLRNRHTKEKQQKVYETESRISKKIHDELANDVYSTMVQLENQTATVPDVIDSLEEIYQNARDISQEKSVYKTNEEFVLDLKRTLGSFTTNDTNLIVRGLTGVLWIDISEIKKVTTIRVLKELLVNMAKHSQASIVSIIFNKSDTKLSISYVDNGVGLYKNELINGTGLINAENRIKAVGGTFIFDETNRGGLKLDIRIPL